MLGLSQYAGQLSVSCPCQKDMPNARPHPSTCTTSTIASCLRARNAGHWQHVIFGNTSPVICFAFHACRFAMVISNDFNIFQLPGQRCLWVHPIVWTKMRQPAQWGSEGMDQTWVPPKLGGCRCESWNHRLFLKWWTFVVAWGFSVHHFGTLNIWAWQVVGIFAVYD